MKSVSVTGGCVVIGCATVSLFCPPHPQTRFENLNQNEGADLGQLVDIVVPSFGQDIVKQLQVLISTKYYQFFDSTIIGLVNRITKCSTASREDILKIDELMKVINDIIKDLLP